jgi:TonB family protein
MRTIGVLRSLALAAGICLVAAPSFADITTFRAARDGQDYKLATIEARETWPALDKSRADLPGIAREFGLAAYLASDFVASQFFAERAIAAGAAEGEALRLESDMLLQMSRLKLDPRKTTRGKLQAALEKRSQMPDPGLLTYYAADAVMSFAFSQGEWQGVEAGAAQSRMIAAQVRGVPAGDLHRIGLRQEVARFFDKKEQQPHDNLAELRGRIIADISTAPDDVAATSLVDVYWDVAAWQQAIAATLYALYKFTGAEADASVRTRISGLSVNDRAVRLLNLNSIDATCPLKLTMSRSPQYPQAAGFKGIAGAVYFEVDIDETGKASNGKVLSAVPLAAFGNAVLQTVDAMRYSPGDAWGPECTVAREGRVSVFTFSVR